MNENGHSYKSIKLKRYQVEALHEIAKSLGNKPLYEAMDHILSIYKRLETMAPVLGCDSIPELIIYIEELLGKKERLRVLEAERFLRRMESLGLNGESLQKIVKVLDETIFKPKKR